MNTSHAYTILLCALTGSLTLGCALLSKGDQGAARFFVIEHVPRVSGTDPVQADKIQTKKMNLRLGRVTGALHLEERLVYRDSQYELGYYRERRWTEPPDIFLERLLARLLFEDLGLSRVVGGVGPTLEVRLTAFDEIRVPTRFARARVVARLHDERSVFWEETLTAEIPIVVNDRSDLVTETVKALGLAMQSVIDQIAERAVKELDKRQLAGKTGSQISPRIQTVASPK